MATLEDLEAKSIVDMTDEELRDYLRHTRGRRVVPPKAISDKSRRMAMGKKKAKAVGASSMASLLDALTPEQKAQMLKTLGGTDGKAE